ncbi:receptor-like protein 7 [Lotus japonicus]|uniref:receptor-like protein 7 n=1 Tax=Lotus japonicus TaxID=34305 RepID=UPI00258FD4B9|nr:receptor-like protein 7 [Lotus japonicus]
MRAHIIFWLFKMLFILTNFSTNIFVANSYCLGHQRSALLQLKNNLTFDPAKSKKLVLWNQSDDDCCKWHGVTCYEGHVTALDLSQEFISGVLDDSSALFNLQNLQTLNLAFNDFHSVIPLELFNLKNLMYLNFSMAGFQGKIPKEISQLKRLVILDLSSNNLFGPIDSSLADLKSLSILQLSHNNLSSTVPDSFANFSNLTTLHLINCSLNGYFPKEIFHIKTLEVLDVSENKFLHGSFPNFTPSWSLHNLDVSHTNFSGQIPESISNLKKLTKIDTSYCQFNGTLPSSMSELTQLVHIDLSSNNFTGSLPSFNNSKNLTRISLFHNHLSGELPSSHFEGLSNLVSIDLGFNFFTGNVPKSVPKLPNLRELSLPHNQLSGVLGEFDNASSPMLEVLDLGNNNLEGPFPLSVFNLRTLHVIQLSSNKFNGTVKLDLIRRLSILNTLGLGYNSLTVDINFRDDQDLSPFPSLTNVMLASCKMKGIPSFLRNQSTILYLDLADNEIEGAIPNWIWRLEVLAQMNLSKNSFTSFEGSFLNISSFLFVLDISSNQLQGPIPFIPQHGYYLDYSNNRFSSFNPPDIGNHLTFTTILSLSNNSFHGPIHESFCNASNILQLDLSDNNFTGEIPECFARMSSTLRVLNLAGNKLQGYIPKIISTSCQLKLFDLNDNLLEGTIPEALANCQKLQVLNLGKNVLTDRFPCFLSNITTLRIMILRSNKFHGSIGCSNSTSDWQNLHIVDLAYNKFSGTIPGALLNSWKAMMRDEDKDGTEFGHLSLDLVDNYNPTSFQDVASHLSKKLGEKLTELVANESRSILEQGSTDYYSVDIAHYQDSINIVNKGHQVKLVKIQMALTYVDMSSNYLEGPIPNELMNFKAMNALNLSHNAFMGHIPSTIGNLKEMESLDLSNNSFNGEIPHELASLHFLAYLNLSYNHLVGEIPKGTQVQSFDASSFEGNKELCGPPLTMSCSNESGLSPPASETPDSGADSSSVDWNFLSVELGFIFGFGIFIIPLISWKKWRMWYSKHADEMLFRIIPQLDLVYENRTAKRYKTLRWRR